MQNTNHARKLGLSICFLTIFFNQNIHSQPFFELRFDSRTKDEVCGPVVCTPEGEIFFILWSAKSPDWTFTQGYSTLYKINLEGDTIKWDFQKQDTVLYYLALLYDHDGNLLIGGDAWRLDTTGNRTGKFQWFCKLTTDFEIIWQKNYRIETTGDYFQDLSTLVELPDIFYLYANSIVPDTSYANYSYLFKLNSSGDSIRFYHNSNELKFCYLRSITLQPELSTFTLHLFRGNPPPGNSGCKFIEFDTTFQKQAEGWYHDSWFSDPFYTMNYSNDTYLSCGTYWKLLKSLDQTYYIRVQKMDEDFNIENYTDLTYPDPDKPTYAAWYQSVDYIDPDKIFVGGIEDKHSTIWNSNPSWVYLACLNSNLEIIHEEYYGGDALYETYYVKATPDGGVILTGSVYDDSIQDHERDGFLMKFDSTLFVGTDEPGQNLLSAKTVIFPNPGNDYITAKTSLPVMEFDLYNSLGDNILSLEQPGLEFSIPTVYLSQGIYFWLIKYKDSRIETGKWIKR
jgi:hypothetical protein